MVNQLRVDVLRNCAEICNMYGSIPSLKALTRSCLTFFESKTKNRTQYNDIFSLLPLSYFKMLNSVHSIMLKTLDPCAQDAQHLQAQLHRLFFAARLETLTLSAPAISRLSLGLASTRR